MLGVPFAEVLWEVSAVATAVAVSSLGWGAAAVMLPWDRCRNLLALVDQSHVGVHQPMERHWHDWTIDAFQRSRFFCLERFQGQDGVVAAAWALASVGDVETRVARESLCRCIVRGWVLLSLDQK